ncbi:glycine cleavage system protein GcvH [Larsenimonas rhizosphaerae]|uniref:Glycine cleavage system H protein n=1 Tax=Larsenimonas rhizosphaerae TaxID=2944682 RepID=A0AA42CTU5_9GAMM|nr:glycine cleavage system protein GcvH [Larsenimonas rhizosphaerae]MCM2130727.1 glycine cleavage system protein GcvH [Larsenimonas rhizosphaerae]MCX2523431.1 glycine cleavage system protein GcvH [Larsenimonas rhizosphaerae]
MSQIPENLLYSDSHEWVLDNGDGTITLGITDHAQSALGDVVFVELPEVGQAIEAGEEFGVIESVKAASDLYAPLTGDVIAVNESLEDAPESVNESPYEDAWLIKVKLSDQEELSDLLSATAYAQLLEQEG